MNLFKIMRALHAEPEVGYSMYTIARQTSHTFTIEREPQDVIVKVFEDGELQIYPNGGWRSYFHVENVTEDDLIVILKTIQEGYTVEDLVTLLDMVEQKGEL